MKKVALVLAAGMTLTVEEAILALVTKSANDAAAALGMPEATVRTRFFRARGLLREGLARDIDHAMADAFSFDGSRCDRIVAGVMARLASRDGAAGP